MILSPALHLSTKLFHWDPATRTFSAEASQLGFRAADRFYTKLGRAWDDSCDLGFTLVSSKTGKELTVAIEKEVSDDDYSDGWKVLEFVPCDRKLRDSFKVVVFND